MERSFGELFHEFRLRCGFATLGQFGQALAEQGYVYEDSIFSKWKNNERVPKERDLVLSILKIFVERNAVTTAQEVNRFFYTLGLRTVNEKEAQYIGLTSVVSRDLYNHYEPLPSPNIVFNPVDVTKWNTKVYLLDELSDDDQRYWYYQLQCAVAEAYRKFSDSSSSVKYVFDHLVNDEYSRRGGVYYAVAITTDDLGNQYFSGTMRLVRGMHWKLPSLEVMGLYGNQEQWVHNKKGVSEMLIGEFSRLVVADWVKSKPLILNWLQEKLEQVARKFELEIIYASVTRSMVSFLDAANVEVDVIDGALLLPENQMEDYFRNIVKESRHYFYNLEPMLACVRLKGFL